jgi:glycosyltransferase involved in cell wall biosynthesis
MGMPAPDSWGGPAVSEPPFAAALRGLGVDVTEEIYVYGDKDRPTPVFERVRRVATTALRFRRIVRARDFDIIHLNTAFDLKTLLRDSFTIWLMKPRNAKIFLKIHGSESRFLESENFLIVRLRNYLKTRVDGFGIHTSEEKQNFLRAGFSAEKLFFDKNATTVHARLPPREEPETWLKNAGFKLLFISRFVPTKGLLETVRACAILRTRGFDFTLDCVGDGETRAVAERLVDELDLRAVVNFTGYVSEREVARFLANGDLLVFPTFHAEGFPNILFNAMAAGLPVVTTKIRAAADYLKEPENCLFVEPKNPEMLAEKICQILQNPDLRRTMSENNRRFSAQLTPENVAREFLEIYRQILERD